MNKKETLTSEEIIKQLQQDLAKTNADLAHANATLHSRTEQLADAHAQLEDAHAELDAFHSEHETHSNVDVNSLKIAAALKDAELLRDAIISWLASGEELSPDDRRRLNGTGVRRWGFIMKVHEMMQVNPELIPSFLDRNRFDSVNRRVKAVRNLHAVLQQATRLSNDVLLLLGDEAFNMALMYYHSVQAASNRRVPGARELFRILRRFFSGGRTTDHADEQPPTEAEILRDVKAGLRGKKDVDIHIIHEDSHKEGGKHVVIDKTRTGHSSFTKTENREIDE